MKKMNEKALKMIYKKVKPSMEKKTGTEFTYEMFLKYMAYAHENKMV